MSKSLLLPLSPTLTLTLTPTPPPLLSLAPVTGKSFTTNRILDFLSAIGRQYTDANGVKHTGCAMDLTGNFPCRDIRKTHTGHNPAFAP